MLKATVIQVFRKTNNRIYGYRLQDDSGRIKDVSAEQLKDAVNKGLIQLNNYKITSDNRLIKTKEHDSIINNDRYLILNKNKTVAEFDVFFNTIKIYSKMPYDFTNINDWLEQRAKFSCAPDVKKFF